MGRLIYGRSSICGLSPQAPKSTEDSATTVMPTIAIFRVDGPTCAEMFLRSRPIAGRQTVSGHNHLRASTCRAVFADSRRGKPADTCKLHVMYRMYMDDLDAGCRRWRLQVVEI